MPITETLRKAKKSIVAGALAVAAMVVPIKGQSQEASQEKEPTKPVEALKAPKERQQMLEQAIKSGASNEEIAKYIDFPEFIPVTKEGQFDAEKASEYAKALTPYVKALAEKADTINATEAYKIFKETTGQKNISFEEFEKVKELAENAVEHHNNRGLEGTTCMLLGLLAAGMAFGGGVYASALKDETIVYGHFGKTSIEPLALTGTIIAGASALAMGSLAVLSAHVGINCFKRSPEQSVYNAYEYAHKSYVNETIKGQQQQYKLMDMNQARQYIQSLQGRK